MADLAAVLARILDEEAAARGLPGAAAGLAVDGVHHHAAFGTTSTEDPRPVTADTLFVIGSVTKTFTSLAVAQLVDAGRISFDDPVADHLPEVADVIDLDGITVRQLLDHRAGLFGDATLVGEPTLAAIGEAPRLFAPGEGYSYSNAGFTLAGELVAALTGRSFEDRLQEAVLTPLGMRRSTFRADRAIFERVALPHVVFPDHDPIVLRSGGWQPGWELRPIDAAAGGLAAPVSELLRWGAFHLGDGTVPGEPANRLISPALLAELHRPTHDAEPGARVGLDWVTTVVDGVPVIGHGGLVAGYCSQLFVVPERQVAFACLTNGTNGSLVLAAVWDRVLTEVLGLQGTDPAPLDPPPDRTALAAYAGTYRSSFGPIEVTFADDGAPGPLLAAPRSFPPGELRWQPPPDPPVHLVVTGPDEVATVDHAGVRARRLRFGRDADGSVSWLLWGSRRCPRIPDARSSSLPPNGDPP